MKKYCTYLFISLFLVFSCKKDQKEEDNSAAAETETETTTMTKNSNFKFSLAQWSLHEPFLDGSLDPMDFAEIAKAEGYTGLEYVTQLYPQVRDNKENYRETVMALAAELKKRSDAAGMDNVLLMVDRDGELADPDPEKRAEAVETHKLWMDAAALMGAHAIRANLFGEEDPQKWHKISVASLKELATYGADKGVSILIENHGGLSSNGKALAAVMAEVNMPTCGTLPDFGNFCVKREGGERWGAPCVEEYDIYQGIAELMPYAKGVSAKSYNFDAAGEETKLDYGKLMEIVADAGYTGYIGIEYEGDLDDPKEGMRLTKSLLEKYIN